MHASSACGSPACKHTSFQNYTCAPNQMTLNSPSIQSQQLELHVMYDFH